MSEPDTLWFYFDYIDPLSLILDLRLREYREKGSVAVAYCPFEVNPPPGALLRPSDPQWTARWDDAAVGATELEVSLERPWIVPWTRKAHELAFLAREEDSFGEIHEALFRAYLIEAKDVGRVDILTELARQNGLSPQDVKAVLDVDRHRSDVEKARAQGLRDGIEKVPSLRWKGRILEGNPTAAELREFISAVADED